MRGSVFTLLSAAFVFGLLVLAGEAWACPDGYHPCGPVCCHN
jgi:hypothetical protein